jgi:broad specificity phosphatase PhoE
VRRTIFARHGESEYNVRGTLNGDITVPCGLTERGLEQARALARRVSGERLDLCVTSEFQRVRETADEVLHGREMPRLVLPELNDPLYGDYEGALLDDYRTWASGTPSSELPGERGESRHAIVDRYTRAFRKLLGRPEENILAISHSLPIAYALGARDGVEPGPRVPLVANATPYELSADELERATELLERWVAAYPPPRPHPCGRRRPLPRLRRRRLDLSVPRAARARLSRLGAARRPRPPRCRVGRGRTLLCGAVRSRGRAGRGALPR